MNQGSPCKGAGAGAGEGRRKETLFLFPPPPHMSPLFNLGVHVAPFLFGRNRGSIFLSFRNPSSLGWRVDFNILHVVARLNPSNLRSSFCFSVVGSQEKDTFGKEATCKRRNEKTSARDNQLTTTFFQHVSSCSPTWNLFKIKDSKSLSLVIGFLTWKGI